MGIHDLDVDQAAVRYLSGLAQQPIPVPYGAEIRIPAQHRQWVIQRLLIDASDSLREAIIEASRLPGGHGASAGAGYAASDHDGAFDRTDSGADDGADHRAGEASTAPLPASEASGRASQEPADGHDALGGPTRPGLQTEGAAFFSRREELDQRVRLALARRWSIGMMLWDIEMGDAEQREQAASRLQELMLRVVNQPVRARNAPAVEIPPEHRLDAVQSVVLKVLERLQAGRLPVLGQEDARCLQYLKRMIISFEIQRSTRARREVLVSPVREDARASARTAERAHDGSSGGSYRAIQETLETRAMWSSDQPSGWNERLLGLAHSVLSTAVDELVRSRRHSPRTRERFRDTWKELEGLCFGHLLAQSALKSDRCRPRARETAAAWRTRRNRIHKRRERLRDELVGTLDRLEKRRELPPRVAQFGRRAVLELLNQRQSLSDYESIGK